MQIGCIVNHNSSRAVDLWNKLVQRYDLCELDLFAKFSCRQSNQVAVLGGDGFMIKAIHGHMSHGMHFYGINCGTLGFLMNSFDIEKDDLQKKMANAMLSRLHLIRAKIFTTSGFAISTYAINEVALLRRSMQAIHVRVSIDGISRIDCLVGDGIMLSTPTGSTAYNFSAGGPILPMQSSLFALTPVSPFRPRRWRGALLLQSVRVTFEVLDGSKRPAGLSVDHKLFTDIAGVEMSLCCGYYPTVLFDPGHELELRIIGEQFSH